MRESQLAIWGINIIKGKPYNLVHISVLAVFLKTKIRILASSWRARYQFSESFLVSGNSTIESATVSVSGKGKYLIMQPFFSHPNKNTLFLNLFKTFF